MKKLLALYIRELNIICLEHILEVEICDFIVADVHVKYYVFSI